MPRIRTIKPEFWDSPSTARASAVARLAFIAMWNWADDFGRGTANLKELEGFIFPNDNIEILSGGDARYFRDVVAEVCECFDVTIYEVAGRMYYAVPSWEKHQRNERRAQQSKHPDPDGEGSVILTMTRGNIEINGSSATQERKYRVGVAEVPNISGLGTGEQGNRGTVSSSGIADALPDREDVDEICDLLADRIRANGAKANVSLKWKNEARLLLDRDERPLDEVRRVIDWCQSDSFWKSNILSMPTFREKYDRLRLKLDTAEVPDSVPEWMR